MAAQTLRPGADLTAVIAEVNQLIAASGSAGNVSGAAALRIVRGRVGSDGTVTSGEGFTSELGATGVYTVTFTSAYAVAPSVVVSLGGGGRIVQVSPAVGSFVATQQDSALQTNVNGPFSFIAVGAA